jgi:hypothetical protein
MNKKEGSPKKVVSDIHIMVEEAVLGKCVLT